MAWIESHQALGHHPKTLALASALNCTLPTAVGHLQYLWWWALDYAQDGVVKPPSKTLVVRACLWRGKPEKFWSALLEAGFIEPVGDLEGSVRIHDWTEYAGRLIEKRKKDADRKRGNRASASLREEDSDGRPLDSPEDAVPDGARNSGGRRAYQPTNQPDTNQPTGNQPTPPSPPLHQASGGDGPETCPECDLPIDRNGDGHGLSKSPGRIRNCSLDHVAPRDWPQLLSV